MAESRRNKVEEDKMSEDYILAHKFCGNHKHELEQDEICGCFYCMEIFSPREINFWIDDTSGTAVCPYCGIDSVIGKSSGFPITKEFLTKMNKYWF
jgi:hypothetical protein